MLLAIADDKQPDCEGKPSADHCADGTMVSNGIARETVEGEQVDDVRRETQGKKAVVHIVERVREPGKE